jgi:AraC-like DNA-binding protein
MLANLQDYIIQSKLFKTFKVDDLLFVEYKCLVSEEAADIWTHDNYFAYVLGGRKKWKTKYGEYLVGSEEALFVTRGANTVYQYFEEPFFVLFIFMPDHFIRQVCSKYPKVIAGKTTRSSVTHSVIPLSVNKVLESYFQSLLSYFLQPKPPHRAILKLKLEELVLNILAQPDNDAIRQCFLRLAHNPKVNLEEVMKKHYSYPLSIEDYARLSARSLSSFRRDFKAVFGTTPAKWLMRERLAYSRFLLKTSDKTINEIIEESGFKNRSHFMKSFKKTFGMPPGQFRLLQTESE